MKKRSDYSRSARLVTTTIWLSLVLVASGGISLQAQSTCPNPPEYEVLRQDEDYSYLRDPACRRGPWVALKDVRLGAGGASFLAVGGAAGEGEEGFDNLIW